MELTKKQIRQIYKRMCKDYEEIKLQIQIHFAYDVRILVKKEYEDHRERTRNLILDLDLKESDMLEFYKKNRFTIKQQFPKTNVKTTI